PDLVEGGAKQEPSLNAGELSGEPPVLLRLGKTDKADQIAKADPGDRATGKSVEQAFEQGKKLLEENDLDGALQEFNEVLSKSAKHGEALAFRGLVVGLQGEPDKGLQDLARSAKLSPRFALTHSFRGRLLAKKKEYGKAMEECNEAVRLAPQEASAYFWRAE